MQNLLCKQVFDGSVGPGRGREEKHRVKYRSMRQKWAKRPYIGMAYKNGNLQYHHVDKEGDAFKKCYPGKWLFLLERWDTSVVITTQSRRIWVCRRMSCWWARSHISQPFFRRCKVTLTHQSSFLSQWLFRARGEPSFPVTHRGVCHSSSPAAVV